MSMNINKKSISLIIIICLLLIISLFYENYNFESKLQNYNYNNTSIPLMNKIIIIGDSRMELINNKREKLKIPDSVVFIARSGAKINWLYDSGIPELYKIINNKKKYNYHIVFNLGVNDLDDDVSISDLASKYYKIYKQIITNNNDISFYFLSVNPVDENRIYKYFSRYNGRTNKKIEEFNNYFINKLKKEKLNNINYCDSYNNLNFYLPDGLHYDTNINIMQYIINNCVNTNINYFEKHTLYW